MVTSDLVKILGGPEIFRLLAVPIRPRPGRRDQDALIQLLRGGLPAEALDAVATRFGISASEMLRILRLPSRTLARRKKTGLLSADESDRLVRFARIGGLAEEVLGSSAPAGRWLREPNPALGNTAPIRWLDTDIGVKEIEQLLIRIAHGAYS
jgi:putative toxin-antitoxin system antitoxin component (TIGR02293 family)